MPLDLSPSEEKRSKSKSKLFLRSFKLYRACFPLRPLKITCNQKSNFLEDPFIIKDKINTYYLQNMKTHRSPVKGSGKDSET